MTYQINSLNSFRSVGFIFLFSALFMLLTMVCFIIGIIFEKGLCEPITDPDFKLIKSVSIGYLHIRAS